MRSEVNDVCALTYLMWAGNEREKENDEDALEEGGIEERKASVTFCYCHCAVSSVFFVAFCPPLVTILAPPPAELIKILSFFLFLQTGAERLFHLSFIFWLFLLLLQGHDHHQNLVLLLHFHLPRQCSFNDSRCVCAVCCAANVKCNSCTRRLVILSSRSIFTITTATITSPPTVSAAPVSQSVYFTTSSSFLLFFTFFTFVLLPSDPATICCRKNVNESICVCVCVSTATVVLAVVRIPEEHSLLCSGQLQPTS